MSRTADPARSRQKLGDRFVRRLVEAGFGGSTFAVVETTGRRSGRTRRTPVCNGIDGDTFWLMASVGRSADFVRNLTADPTVRVRSGRRWRTGTAHVVPDDDTRARHTRWVASGGPMRSLDAIAWRKIADDPVTVRIDLSD